MRAEDVQELAQLFTVLPPPPPPRDAFDSYATSLHERRTPKP
jgi:hypothetical protein